jgi:hypothetical protein
VCHARVAGRGVNAPLLEGIQLLQRPEQLAPEVVIRLERLPALFGLSSSTGGRVERGCGVKA